MEQGFRLSSQMFSVSFESGTSTAHHSTAQLMAKNCCVLSAVTSSRCSTVSHSHHGDKSPSPPPVSSTNPLSFRNKYITFHQRLKFVAYPLAFDHFEDGQKCPNSKEHRPPPDSLPCFSPLFTSLNSVALHIRNLSPMTSANKPQ